MATTMEDIRQWFETGVENECNWMLVVVDTWDHTDYPVYADDPEGFWAAHESSSTNMQRVMESYDLSDDMEPQLAKHRCHRQPERPEVK